MLVWSYSSVKDKEKPKATVWGLQGDLRNGCWWACAVSDRGTVDWVPALCLVCHTFDPLSKELAGLYIILVLYI